MPSIPQNLYSFQKLARSYLRETATISFDEAHVRRAYWTNRLLESMGIEYEVTNREKLIAHRPCVYVSNHTSLLDPLVMCAIFDYDVRFFAKKPLFKVPLLSRALTLEKHIPVDRSAHDKSHIERLRELTSQAIQNGGCVFIFPEGTRSSTGRIGSFKLSAFFNAVQNNVPVVPVILHGLYDLCPKTTLRIRPGKCTVEVLDAVMPEVAGDEKARATELCDRVRTLMVSAHEGHAS